MTTPSPQDIAKAMCCPLGCLRSEDCFSMHRRYGADKDVVAAVSKLFDSALAAERERKPTDADIAKAYDDGRHDGAEEASERWQDERKKLELDRDALEAALIARANELLPSLRAENKMLREALTELCEAAAIDLAHNQDYDGEYAPGGWWSLRAENAIKLARAALQAGETPGPQTESE